MKNIELSIIVPCYNEEKNIPILLKNFERVIDRHSNVEIVLVNNGSTDNTDNIVDQEIKKNNYKFITKITIKKNIGYGYGILSGLYKASGSVFAWTHADLQADPADVFKAFEIYNSNKNKYSNLFVKGARKGRKLTDKIFSLGMQIFASILLKENLAEINAQPKLFPASFLDQINDPPLDFSLDLYFLYIATIKRYKIMTLPVDFNERIYGEAKGGGGSDFKTKIKLIKRTFKYILELKSRIKKGKI